MAARATGNAGGCRFALHQYRTVLTLFLEARRLAGQANDASAQAAFDDNIASLYSESGEFEAAAQWIESGLERLSGDDRRLHLPKMLIQMATLRARQNRMGEALELFRRGIEAADAAGDVELVATAWNRLGEEWLKQGDLEKAEGPLLEAYRLRRFHHLALDSSYRNLGRLRLQQGDLVSSSVLLDRGVGLAARPGGPLPAWDMYHYRGRVRLRQGRLREALDDLRVAVRLARAWRWSTAPGDAARMGAEGVAGRCPAVGPSGYDPVRIVARQPALLGSLFCHRSRMNREPK